MAHMDIRLFSFVADDETDCYILALGEDKESVLMLQLAYHFDEQDEENGQNTYCIISPEGTAVYGGIWQYTLDTSRLLLQFTEEAFEVLGTTSFDLTLHLSPAEWQALADALAVIFNVPKDRPEVGVRT